MSNSNSDSDQEKVVQILTPVEIDSSGEDPPMSEWSSLIIFGAQVNKKRVLHSRGLYSPGSGEVCGKYISMSDSDVSRHHYYNYPAVLDPGITQALLNPDKPVIYKNDGQDLYLALCKEMKTPVVRMFHTGLVTSEINLSYYGVHPNAVRTMAQALQYNKTVRRLNLTDNFLNNDSCYHLAQMLTTNSTIRELILAGCRIGPSGILRLGSTLAVNRSLEELNLARNCLGEDGGPYLAKQIGNGAGVPRLDLSNNDLGRLTAMALAEALEYRNKLTHLNLSWNNFFHAPSVVKLLEQLSFSSVLEELNLSWNSLEGERIATGIRDVLSLPTLKMLYMRNNKFSDEAVTLLIAGLAKSKKMSLLDLSFNPLKTKDVNALLEKMLRPRLKLDTLLLEGIPVAKTFPALLDRVKNLKTRKNFSIQYGRVLSNWTVEGPEKRKLVMERAKYLGMKDKKRRVDIAMYFLTMEKEYPKPIPVKDLIDRLSFDNVPLDDDLVNEISALFSGSKTPKSKTVDISAICDYIHRIWPDKRLPPTPPPEPEPEPEPLPPPPPPPKGKGKGKKK